MNSLSCIMKKVYILSLTLFCFLIACTPKKEQAEIETLHVKVKLVTNYGEIVLQL